MKYAIEPLEDRIAPATLVNPTTVMFTDVDGDTVTVKITKGTFDPGLGEFTFVETSPGREQLRIIKLTDAKFEGTNLSITAKRSKDTGGDGFVHVGLIDGRDGIDAVNFGSVVVDGDIGALRAGTMDPVKPAVKSLTAASLAAFGTATQGGTGNVDFRIQGSLGKLVVKGDVHGSVRVGGIVGAKIGSVIVGGSLVGGDDLQSGTIAATGNIGPVKIGGSLIGSAAFASGSIFTDEGIASVTVGGSIRGGAGNFSGVIDVVQNIGSVKVRGDILGSSGGYAGMIRIFSGSLKSLTVGGSIIGSGGLDDLGYAQISVAGDLGAVKIAGDIRGGDTYGTGRIQANSLGSVKIGGSLIGSTGDFSGVISANLSIGSVAIRGNFVAGSGDFSGVIYGDSGIKSVTIGGSWDRTGGTSSRIDALSGPVGSVKIGGDITSNGGDVAIRGAGTGIGAIVIGGDIIGGSVTSLISVDGALGSMTVKGSIVGNEAGPVRVTVAKSIGKVMVGGSMEYGILAVPGVDAVIGSVTVGRDFIASRIAVGTTSGLDGIFGTNDDGFTGGGDPGKLSTLGKLTIKGQAYGTVGGTDSFLIMAEKIGKITVGGTAIPGSDDPGDIPIGFTGDLVFRDLPLL